ncbi:MAG: DMT family transporter [Pseudomonadota bacterium]
MSPRHLTILVLLGIAFGGVFVLNAILLRDIGPLAVSFWRIALGALACWTAVLVLRLDHGLTAREIRQAALLGVITYAMPLTFYPVAQGHIASGVTGIVNAMTPIMVVIVSHAWPDGERATWLKSCGVTVGFVGIILLALPTLETGVSSQTWAMGVALLAPVCYAVAFNYVRRLRHRDPIVVTAYAMVGATLALLPLNFAFDPNPWPSTLTSWGALALLGPLLTGVAFMLVTWLTYRVGATATSTVTFIAPVSAVILGALILGERIGPLHLAGMAGIFAGLLLIDGRVARIWRQSPNH